MTHSAASSHQVDWHVFSYKNKHLKCYDDLIRMIEPKSAKHNDVAVRNEMRVMIKGVLKQKHTRAVRISLIGTMGPSRTQITALRFCCVCEAALLAKQNSFSRWLSAPFIFGKAAARVHLWRPWRSSRAHRVRVLQFTSQRLWPVGSESCRFAPRFLTDGGGGFFTLSAIQKNLISSLHWARIAARRAHRCALRLAKVKIDFACLTKCAVRVPVAQFPVQHQLKASNRVIDS